MKHDKYFCCCSVFSLLKEQFKVHWFNAPCMMEQRSIEMVSTLYIVSDMRNVRDTVNMFFLSQFCGYNGVMGYKDYKENCCLKMVTLDSNTLSIVLQIKFWRKYCGLKKKRRRKKLD